MFQLQVIKSKRILGKDIPQFSFLDLVINFVPQQVNAEVDAPVSGHVGIAHR